jgi:tetratricopeptide (TPR) repeat protein
MRVALRIVAAGVLGATVFLAGAVRLPAPDGRREVALLEDFSFSARVTAGSASEVIGALQDRLEVAPSDWGAAASLGLAYVQQARITADPTSYPRAEEAFRHSLSLRRDNVEALVGMGTLALARHEFGEALDWGRRAVSANPYGVAGHGVVGDALVELGRYSAAFRAFQRMADLRPGLSAYARASYARELQGDIADAIGLMRMAERSAGSAEDAAWVAFELGELLWSTGRLRDAEASYRRAMRWAPSYVAPMAGLSRILFARGRVREAIRLYRRVVDTFPAPEHVAALGDLYATNGRPALARDQYALVRAEQSLIEASGVNVDLELALFDADHGRPRTALRAARAAWAERKSVTAADTLAWALHLSGRSREAAMYARRALRLGTRHPLFLFHAGMIQLHVGHERHARRLIGTALRLNPHFSIIHARAARRALARLEATG